MDDEPFVKVKRSFSIGVSAVTSFGYRKDMAGRWVRKQDLPPPIPNERTPSPPPQRDTSSSLLTKVLTEFCDLQAFVGELFDAMDTQITQLEDDMSFIRRCFNPPADSYFCFLCFMCLVLWLFLSLVFWLLILSTLVTFLLLCS